METKYFRKALLELLIHKLMIINLVWIAGSFIFFLLGFLVKYMPGDVYFNSVISGLSAFAMLSQGKLEVWFGVQKGMIASFVLCLMSVIFLCFFDPHTDYVLLFAFILLLAKSGASLAFGFVYAIHIELFPSYLLISSYGICNFFCRGITIFAPLVAEVENEMIPNLFMVGLAFLGLAAASMVRKIEEKPVKIVEPGEAIKE